MNVLLWNIRSIQTSIFRLQSLTRQYKLHLLVLIEPKLRTVHLEQYRLQLGFSYACSLDDGHIWIMWRDSFMEILNVRKGVQNMCSAISSLTCS